MFAKGKKILEIVIRICTCSFLDIVRGRLKTEFKLAVKRAVYVLLEIARAHPGKQSCEGEAGVKCKMRSIHKCSGSQTDCCRPFMVRPGNHGANTYSF